MTNEMDKAATDAALNKGERLVEHVQLNQSLDDFRARLALELHALEIREKEIRDIHREYMKKIKRLRVLLGVSRQSIKYDREDRVMVIFRILEEHGAMSLGELCKLVGKTMGFQFANPVTVCKLLSKHDGMFIRVEKGVYAIVPRVLELKKARDEVMKHNAESRIMLGAKLKEQTNEDPGTEP